MGVIARQSIKGALANYLGVAIGFFTTFFVLTHCLTQEEIGLTRVMVDAAMLFSGLAQLGTNASIIRFFPFFKSDDGKNHGIFGWSVLIPMVGFMLFALCFFIFKQDIVDTYSLKSPLIADYAYLLLPLTFFALYLTVFETNASVLLRITVPRLVREVGIRLFNLVCYLLYGYGAISLDLFVLLFCLSYAVAMLINFGYLLSLGKISFRIDWSFINRQRLKEMALYTLFMTATVLAGNIPLINSLFLGAKTGLALTGVYTIAFYIANIVEVPYRSLGAISRPMVSQAVRDGDWQEVNRLGRQVSLHQFLVTAGVGRHLFHDLENLLFLNVFFLDFNRNVLFDNFVLVHIGVDFDVFHFNVVLHDFELRGLLGHFHRLGLLLLLFGDFHHFLIHLNGSIEQAGVDLALVVALVFESHPCKEQADNHTYLDEHQFLVLKVGFR